MKSMTIKIRILTNFVRNNFLNNCVIQLWQLQKFMTVILPQFHHCDCEMCERLIFGTFSNFLALCESWFFMHCRNHHSGSHATHVINKYRWHAGNEIGIRIAFYLLLIRSPDSKVHGANMGPIWGRQDPGGPHVGPMNFTIWEPLHVACATGI